MTRKRCNRRRWNLMDPVALAIAGARPIDDERNAQLLRIELGAITAFQNGTATVQHWSNIADIANLAETMALDGIGPEVLTVVKQVETALLEAKDRYERTGRMGTTGAGLRALIDIQEYHNLQRTAVSLSEYERYITKTANRIRSAHPTVKVCL